MEKMKQKYLEKMAELYPTIAEASTEIINLQSMRVLETMLGKNRKYMREKKWRR